MGEGHEFVSALGLLLLLWLLSKPIEDEATIKNKVRISLKILLKKGLPTCLPIVQKFKKKGFKVPSHDFQKNSKFTLKMFTALSLLCKRKWLAAQNPEG